jgi:hypothetical protein
MKIGILTFLNAQDNYGQVLQGYALKKYLENKGHSVHFINYNRYDIVSNKKNIITKLQKLLNLEVIAKYIAAIFYKKIYQCSLKIHNRNFDLFREKHFSFTIKYNTWVELKKNPPEMDIYITGSDQVWNFPDISHCKNIINAFFLNFGNALKISYAASFGANEFSNEYYSLISPLLNDFLAISVREESGCTILEKLGFKKSQLVPDPCFLLKTKYWQEIMTDRVTDKGFICIYLINNQIDISARKIISNFLGEKYYCISGQERINFIKKTYPTIEEWLELIFKADCVITNSYHGLVFSLIFNKKFIVIPLTGEIGKHMNTRIYSLLNKLNIQDRILDSQNIENIQKLINTEIDYETTNEKLAAFIDIGKEFLDGLR